MFDHVFPYIYVEELRPIVHQILLNFGPDIPEQILSKLKSDQVFENLPTKVKIHVWESDPDYFFIHLDKILQEYDPFYADIFEESPFKAPLIFDMTSDLTNLDIFTTNFRRSNKLLDFLVCDVFQYSHENLFPKFLQYCRNKFIHILQKGKSNEPLLQPTEGNDTRTKKPRKKRDFSVINKNQEFLSCLGRIRYDTIMYAHDKQITQLQKVDASVHRFCWWMDAWLRTVITGMLSFFNVNSTFDLNKRKQNSMIASQEPSPKPSEGNVITTDKSTQAERTSSLNVSDMVDVRRMNELIQNLSQIHVMKKNEDATVGDRIWLDLQMIMCNYLHSNAVLLQIYYLLELTEPGINAESLASVLSSIPVYNRKKNEELYTATVTVTSGTKSSQRSGKIKVKIVGNKSKKLTLMPTSFLNDAESVQLSNCLEFLSRLFLLKYNTSNYQALLNNISSVEPIVDEIGLTMLDLFIQNDVFPFIQQLIAARVSDSDYQTEYRKSIQQLLSKALRGSNPIVILYRKLVCLTLLRIFQNVRILTSFSTEEEQRSHSAIEEEVIAQTRKFHFLLQCLFFEEVILQESSGQEDKSKTTSPDLSISNLGLYLIKHDASILHTLLSDCERLVPHLQNFQEFHESSVKSFSCSANCILAVLQLVCGKLAIAYLNKLKSNQEDSHRQSIIKNREYIELNLSQVMFKFATVSHDLAVSGHFLEREQLRKLSTTQEKSQTEQERLKKSAATLMAHALSELTRSILQFFSKASESLSERVRDMMRQTQDVLQAPIQIQEPIKKGRATSERKQRVYLPQVPSTPTTPYGYPPSTYGRGYYPPSRSYSQPLYGQYPYPPRGRSYGRRGYRGGYGRGYYNTYRGGYYRGYIPNYNYGASPSDGYHSPPGSYYPPQQYQSPPRAYPPYTYQALSPEQRVSPSYHTYTQEASPQQPPTQEDSNNNSNNNNNTQSMDETA